MPLFMDMHTVDGRASVDDVASTGSVPAQAQNPAASVQNVEPPRGLRQGLT
jgi:hypothetical protein